MTNSIINFLSGKLYKMGEGVEKEQTNLGYYHKILI